jgi:hypothetical protein
MNLFTRLGGAEPKMSFRSSSHDTNLTSGVMVENAIERAPSDSMSLSLLGDAKLVRLATRGDEAAFAAIFRRYHEPLFRYCQSITGNNEDASEALQNTMVTAKRALPGERPTIEMKSWLFSVAHDQSMSLLRRRPQDAALEEESHGPAVEGPRRADSAG